MENYDEIENFICNELADEEYYVQQEREHDEAMQEEWQYWQYARMMGWE